MIQIESEENVPLLKVIFEQGEMAGRTLVSKMLSCTEVTCTCGSIHLDFGKDEDGSALWLDTYEKQVDTIGEDERLTPLAEKKYKKCFGA
jgi:hypothetical protein